jgi:cytochrome c biogenesis protein ResB
VNWLASARSDPNQAGEFIEAPVAPADLPHATKAVCLSIDFGGQQVLRWVAQGSATSVDMAENVIRFAYAPEEKPLPFNLSVASVRRANVSAGEPVGYATDVVFTAPDGTVSRQSVQINHPATFDGVSVFSGPVDEHDAASPVATLDVRKDPGRSLKYLGGVLIVAGTIGVFMFGSVEDRKRRPGRSARGSEPAMATATA